MAGEVEQCDVIFFNTGMAQSQRQCRITMIGNVALSGSRCRIKAGERLEIPIAKILQMIFKIPL